MKVKFSYLDEQFANPQPILEEIRKLVLSGDFTLGRPVAEFENGIAKFLNCRFALGVGTGTDALFLSLKAIGVGPGDEVITSCNTFYATAGAIVAAGAKPVFVDVDDSFNIDAEKTEEAITNKTKAIMPVHYMGLPANLPKITEIVKKRELPIIEDACQALGASINNRAVGTYGIAGALSFHPLKNLNVWGDAGMIVTNDNQTAERLKLIRNHGLKNRDELECFGYNSRLDSMQAIVGKFLLKDFDQINKNKERNARLYDEAFSKLAPRLVLPKVRPGFKHAYHLYMMLAEHRDCLLNFLEKRGIEAKIHYPVPLHLQKPCRMLGYKKGDFPVCEKQCDHYITLPVHQHLTTEQVQYVISSINEFYSK